VKSEGNLRAVGKALDLLANIRLVIKTNYLTYFSAVSVTNKKSFIKLPPGRRSRNSGELRGKATKKIQEI
jgi:hypothetical protein